MPRASGNWCWSAPRRSRSSPPPVAHRDARDVFEGDRRLFGSSRRRWSRSLPGSGRLRRFSDDRRSCGLLRCRAWHGTARADRDGRVRRLFGVPDNPRTAWVLRVHSRTQFPAVAARVNHVAGARHRKGGRLPRPWRVGRTSGRDTPHSQPWQSRHDDRRDGRLRSGEPISGQRHDWSVDESCSSGAAAALAHRLGM